MDREDSNGRQSVAMGISMGVRLMLMGLIAKKSVMKIARIRTWERAGWAGGQAL